MLGDRFFFTHTGQSGSFTKAGRSILVGRTLAGIICDNTAITKVPANVFELTDPSAFIPCSQTPTLNSAQVEELLK